MTAMHRQIKDIEPAPGRRLGFERTETPPVSARRDPLSLISELADLPVDDLLSEQNPRVGAMLQEQG